MLVAIIGAGVVGLSIGVRLRDAGADVVLLERSIPGAEASSAAAGMLAPQVEAKGPGPFLELCLKSRALYPSFAAELKERADIDIAYLTHGTLSVAFDDDTAAHLRDTARWQAKLGLQVELLTGDQARAQEAALSHRVLSALFFPNDHQVDNRLLVRALTQAAVRAGAEFKTGYVRGLLRKGERVVGVDLDGAPLHSDAVVVAAGSWTGLIPGLPLSPKHVRPAKGQIVQLQMRAPPLRRVAVSRKGYVVPRTDGRVLCGTTLEFKGFDKQVTAEGMVQVLSAAVEICPDLAAATFDECWAGLRPYTDSELPLLGAGPLEGLFLATGHFRNGILLAPMTGQLMADAVLGRPLSLDLAPFAPIGA